VEVRVLFWAPISNEKPCNLCWLCGFSVYRSPLVSSCRAPRRLVSFGTLEADCRSSRRSLHLNERVDRARSGGPAVRQGTSRALLLRPTRPAQSGRSSVAGCSSAASSDQPLVRSASSGLEQTPEGVLSSSLACNQRQRQSWDRFNGLHDDLSAPAACALCADHQLIRQHDVKGTGPSIGLDQPGGRSREGPIGDPDRA
jgi:hypothetical protein